MRQNVNAFNFVGSVLGTGGHILSRFQRGRFHRPVRSMPKRTVHARAGTPLQHSMRMRGVSARRGGVKAVGNRKVKPSYNYRGTGCVTASGHPVTTKYSSINTTHGGKSVYFGKGSGRVTYRGKKFKSGPFAKKAMRSSMKASRTFTKGSRSRKVGTIRRGRGGMVKAHVRHSIRGKSFKVRQHTRRRR